MKNKGNLYILITAFLWSLGGLFVKLIPYHPIAINGLRSMIAFIFFSFYLKNKSIQINKTIIIAAACLTLTNTLYVIANKMTTAANVIVLQYSAPIFVLCYQSIYEKKLPSKQKLFIMFTTVIGMIVFFFDQLDHGNMLGNILSILSGVSFAGVFFFNSLPSGSSEDASRLGFLISFITSIPFLFSIQQIDTITISSLAILGIFQVGVAYVFFSKGIKLTTAINSSLISLIEVLLNPLWVFLFAGEMPSIFAIIGGCIILFSIIINIILDEKKGVYNSF